MRRYTYDQHVMFSNSIHTYNVFHIDKLTQDRAKTKASKERYLNIIDISYRSSNEIIKIILDLKIEVFIFYTFQSLLDKFLWQICQNLGIPTIFHDHGIVFGNKIVGESKYNISLIRLKRKLSFLIKNFQLNFLTDNIYSKKLIKREYNFDHYILFSHNNANYYNTFFKLTERNFTITGIPLFRDENELLLLKKIIPERKILYIHQPLRKFKFSSISFNEEIEFINSINKIVKKLNYKLVVRLHPSQSLEELASYDLNSGITLDNKTNLQLQAATASIILGHWSTALSIAYPLNKPLIILEYPNVYKKYSSFYSIFKNVGIYCKSVKQLEGTIENIQTISKIDDDKWRDLIGQDNTIHHDSVKLNKIINLITSNDNVI